MYGRSIALYSVFFLAVANAASAPGESATAVPRHPGFECERALVSAQEMQAMVGPGIVAFVQIVPITSFEVRQRILWHVALARDEDMMAKTRSRERIVLELRREVQERIAAARAEIMLSSADVDAQIDDFLSYQDLTRHELQMSLERAGVQMATMRSVVAVDMLRARLNRAGLERFHVPPWNCLKAQ